MSNQINACFFSFLHTAANLVGSSQCGEEWMIFFSCTCRRNVGVDYKSFFPALQMGSMDDDDSTKS